MSTDQTDWQTLQQTLDDLSSSQKLELIERVARSLREGKNSANAAEQRANLERLQRELATLPVRNPADGFSNRDHDAELYGGSV